MIRLADTLLLTHSKVKTNANPFVERDYAESRSHDRDIQNVSGPYRAVWERQSGRCYYCGRPILVDQPRTTVPLDLTRPPSIRNSAYIHKMCAVNEFEIVQTMEDISILRPYDVYGILEGITLRQEQKRIKREIRPNWRHYKLKEFLSKSAASSITLTFAQIEEIDGRPLPLSARKTGTGGIPGQTAIRLLRHGGRRDIVSTRLILKKKRSNYGGRKTEYPSW